MFQMFALANAWSCDEDVDYVYKLFNGREGTPYNIINQNMELIKEGRPGLYERLKKVYKEVESFVSKIEG